MKIGLQINRFDWPEGTREIGSKLESIAQTAEAVGFDSLWVMDHFFQLPSLGPKDDPMLEAYTTLGYLAGVTTRMKLGTLVTGVIYREPAVLIKAVTTLDVVSGGRAYFGIGAGWNEQEAVALALPHPLTSKRFLRLEDTLKLAKQMWSGNREPFHGSLYHLPEPISSPQPVQQPHPPILIGGGGEERTLRLVAEYGDACNLFATDLQTLRHKLEVLRGHCRDVGRNYDEIEKTALGSAWTVTKFVTQPEEAMKLASNLAGLGVTHMILGVGNDGNLESYEKIRPYIAQIHAV